MLVPDATGSIDAASASPQIEVGRLANLIPPKSFRCSVRYRTSFHIDLTH